MSHFDTSALPIFSNFGAMPGDRNPIISRPSMQKKNDEELNNFCSEFRLFQIDLFQIMNKRIQKTFWINPAIAKKTKWILLFEMNRYCLRVEPAEGKSIFQIIY